MGYSRSHLRNVARGPGLLVVVGVVASMILVFGRPAVAAPQVSVKITSTPNPVATGQAIAFRIVVTNNGSAAASGVTLTNTFIGVGSNGPYPVQLPNGPVAISNLGSCTFSSPIETCTAPTVGAGQVWTVTITLAVTAAAGATFSDTAAVTGTESSTPFSATGTASGTASQTLPSGFAQTTLLTGLKKPIVLAFAPNGDMYVGEQAGAIVIDRHGVVLPTPVITLTTFNVGETGLLGMALDPNFATNGYIYISYTIPITTSAGPNQPFAQLSRFTVVNGVASPASEKIYYRGNQVQNQDGTGGNYDHAGNDVKIGPDGKLWWSVGDNVPAISNGQNLKNIFGKILRFNLDGSVPTDNPFVDVTGAVPYIYAYGLRNPWRFTFAPTGQAVTEDTGSSFWEDLNTIEPGGNYGWPIKEGNCGSCGYLNPAYAYGHYPTDSAASAIAAYSGSAFPSSYGHVVFFGDYVRRDIEAVSFDPTYKTATSDTVFDTNAGTIADLVEGPDGNLYFASIFEGKVSEISAPGPFPPSASASATPNAGTTPVTVQLSSAGSTDPYGKPLTYAWDFGDGSAPSTGANPSHTYAAAGTYTATLTVSNGTQTGKATTTVVVGSSPPTATITAPDTYNAGTSVSFSGTATDPTDGVLPASDYTWQVDFYSNGVLQPSYYAEVAHPFSGPVTGVPGSSITIPSDPSQVPGSFYRITLTVTDSLGIQTVVTKDIHPNLTTWSAGTNVPGAGYFVDGAWQTGPDNVQDVVGVVHVLSGMPLAQTISGSRYRFLGWADGNALTDTVTAGSGPGSYTAEYEAVTTTMPSPWQSTDVGAPISAGGADYAPGDTGFYVDGAGSDAYGANDQFHYVYQTLSGDGTIVARVRYQTNSSAWAKAGVMIKQSAVAGAPFVDALVAPDVSPNTPNIRGVGCDANGCLSPLPPVTPAMGYGVRMQYSGSKSHTPSAYPPGFTDPNKWLELQRVGNTFTSWLSADGVTWTKIGSTTLTMTGPVTIGLFDTSHNIGELSTAAFDHVQVTGATSPPPPGPPSITLAPATQSAGTGATQTVTATAVDGSGNPLSGTTVTFNVVSGPNASQTATAGTNAAGHATFTVTSTTAGTDTIQASFVDSTATTRTSNSVLVAFTTGTTGGVVISNLSVSDTARASQWSVQPNLQAGAVIYADRTYTLTAAPSLVLGDTWIRDTNGSKAFTGNPLVSFTINQQANVFVGMDKRVGRPAWLDSTWSDTGLTESATGPVTYEVFQKTFPVGSVALGPLGTTAVAMYTIAVK
jgi:glucose/arabinose dehydrogenase